MNISCIIGMVGAVLLAGWGLAQGTTFTLFLAIFGFYMCYQERLAPQIFRSRRGRLGRWLRPFRRL